MMSVRKKKFENADQKTGENSQNAQNIVLILLHFFAQRPMKNKDVHKAEKNCHLHGS
jgi:hypothetical protein